jgi:hypothetical protein
MVEVESSTRDAIEGLRNASDFRCKPYTSGHEPLTQGIDADSTSDRRSEAARDLQTGVTRRVE